MKVLHENNLDTTLGSNKEIEFSLMELIWD